MSLCVVGVSSPAYLFLEGLQDKEQLVLPIKERGNTNFRDGRYRAAIGDYTRAIRILLVSSLAPVSLPFPPPSLSPSAHTVLFSTVTGLSVISKMEIHGEQPFSSYSLARVVGEFLVVSDKLIALVRRTDCGLHSLSLLSCSFRRM